jgi:hypothetical protein
MMSIEDVLKEMREAKLDKWVAVIEQTLADKDAEFFHATRRLKRAARQREMAVAADRLKAEQEDDPALRWVMQNLTFS